MSIDDTLGKQIKRKDPLYNKNRFRFSKNEDLILKLNVLEYIDNKESNLQRFEELSGIFW